MSCDLTCHLIDDYLDDQLSQRERQRLEKHLSACPQCARELHERLAFERTLRQALTASVQHLQLPPDVSRGIVRAVKGGARQPSWRGYATRVAEITAGVVVVTLLLAGLSLLLGRVPAPSDLPQAIPPLAKQPILSFNRGNIFVEPRTLRPGDLFTVTVPIDNAHLRPLDTVHCDLDIRGPTGHYRYGLAVKGPLPDRGAVILQVTPGLLATPSREQYNLAVREILSMPGVYHFRVTLSGQAAPSVE